MYPWLLWQNGSVKFSTSSCVRLTQFFRWSHQLSGDKCNNIWVLVGMQSEGYLLVLLTWRALFPWRGCRGQRKFILEFPVWETSPLLRHPPDFCLIRNRHHMWVITYHSRTTEAEGVKTHQKNNIPDVSDGTSSSRLINRGSICLSFMMKVHLYNIKG